MNANTLRTIVKGTAQEANLTVSFFTVSMNLNEKTYKIQYKDEGGRSTQCTDCPSKLVVYTYIDKNDTGAETQLKLNRLVSKIKDHYGE